MRHLLSFGLVLLCITAGTLRAARSHANPVLQAAPNTLISPRLAALAQALKLGNRKAVNDFWQEISQVGTPLVEPTPDSGTYVYVTFLWRGNPETRNVVVLTLDNSQLANSEYLALSQMSPLADTNVWFRTYRLRNDARFSYRIAANDSLSLLTEQPPEDRVRRLAAFAADPLNPKHYASRNGDSSVVELKAAPAQTLTVRQPGVPEGRVEKFRLKSRTLGNEREISVYTPPGYGLNQELNKLVVMLDGETYQSGIPAATILDNLIAKGDLRPTVAVMVGNADGARLQELWHSEPFAEFVAAEVVPWIRQRYRVSVKAALPEKSFLYEKSGCCTKSLYAPL